MIRTLETGVETCYNCFMYNWSTDENELKKHPEKYKIWRLEQQINFGLGEAKLEEQELRKYFSRINIDPYRRKFLNLLLNGE